MMKNIFVKNTVLILGCLSMICACSINHDNSCLNLSETSICLDGVDQASINDLVDSIYYMGLSDINGEIPVMIDKLYAIDGMMYIGDFRQGKVFAYDKKSGSPRFIIDGRGSGPEEYVEIRCMAVDDSALYIVDNYTQRMLVYDNTTGKCLSTKKIPVVADDIEILDNGGFLLASAPMRGVKLNTDQPEYRLFVTDRDMNIQDMFYGVVNKMYDPIGQRQIFSRCDDGIVYSSVMIDGFTVINPDDVSNHHRIRLPFTNGLEGKKDVDLDEVSHYEHLSSVPYICGDNVYLQYTSGNGQLKSGIWNAKYNGLLQNSTTDLSKAVIPPVGVIDGCFVSMMDSYDLYEMATNDGFCRAPMSVEQLLRDDSGIALVFYKMK